MLVLLQAWLSEPRWARSELWLVTSDAVAAVAEDGVEGLANAPLWGLVRSVRSEHPEIVLRLLDIQGDSPAESVRAALFVQDEPDLALRGQKVLAPRLMLANVSPQTLGRPTRLQRTNGTVLITGGTGALAQVVAHHLVKVHGVRHLMLTSRRGPEAAGAGALRTELEQLGAHVTLSDCDVTRREAVAALLQSIPAESPLSAVFHCAGTLDDGPVESLTADRIERVFGPKIDAALHLHELTAHLDLEAFVLFSSVAGVVGSPMKGNYAAANAFLDALAAYRHQRGQAAQSLAWGLWQPRGAGMTAELSRANLESIRRLEGIAPLSIEQGLHLLDSALAQPEASLVPVHLDVLQLARKDKPVPALFRGLIKDRASMPPAALGKGSDSVALCQRLAALSEADGLDAVVALVRSEVATVLGLANAAAIPPDRQLKSLGLDSLMTLDLRNRLQARLGLRIDISLLRLPDPQSVAVEILRRCRDESSAQGTTSERPAASASDEKVDSKVADRTASDPSAAAISAHRPQLGSLSSSQQRLWFLHQALERPETYNLSIAFRVHSSLHSQFLMQALDAVTARHEQLRVCFIEHDGVPQQRVLPWVEPALQIDDLSHLPIEQRERTLAQKLSDQARQPFSLSQSPLLRMVLFQLGPTECVLTLTWHHIITDGVSLGIFFAELSEAYQTLSSGREPAWSRAPSYLRYCERSQAWLQTPEAQAQREWWRQELKDLQPLNLPTDRPAPKMSSKRGGCTTFDLSPASSRAVAELTAAAECTPFVVLFAAWSALLSRYCGQQDFAIGTDVVNRPEAELQNVLGFFVNTLPIRCDLSGDPSVAELLQRMRGRIWSVLDRQELPLNEVVRVALSWRQEDLSSSPLFCVGFVLEESRWFPRSFGGAALEPLTRTISGDVEGTAKFDLSMAVVQTDLGYRATLEYAQDLFDASSVERLAIHYQRILTAMVEDLKRPLSALPLLSDAERRQILVQWNATTAAYPKGCIPELFAQQVARTPDAVALFFEGQTLTYRELDARTNQLAHYLQSLGVGREVRVGIYLERSLELPLAILGILKAGGAYVPLDPDSPHRRLGLVVEDAELRVLIGHSERLPLSWLGERESFTQVDLSDATVAERIAAMSEAPPACAASAHSLAYVIYTSGSTGTPKGVQMEHHSVLNLVESHKHRFGDQPSAVTLVSPVVSDPSVSNLLGALLGGHTLFVVDQSTWRDGEALLDYLRIHAIEVCDCTPALLRLLVEAGLPTAQGLALRMLLCGGEALPTALVQTLYAPGIHSRLTVVNLYGPTECCVDVTALDLSAQNLPAAAVVPLGRPLLNTRIYVLDQALRPVPIGVSGELCIGGAGVSRGYLNRPDLTAQKFVPDPFSDDASARLYKSGDLARFLADGTIEFLGRLDHQIKLRGYRIELGEVESALATHPDVHSCAVVVREDLPGDKRLCAYLVSRSAAPPSLASLREHLGVQLPEYMLPASFVFLPDLPLSANGKIDQKALPVPSSQGDREEYEPPSTALEQSLADIFATVLHLDRVGRNDNYFAIGGHSLLATQAISRIRSTLQIELPLRTLFEAPTVGGLAQVLHRPDGLACGPERSPRLPGCPAPDRWRCRLLSSGCGSSINLTEGVPPTTFSPRCASEDPRRSLPWAERCKRS